MVQGNRAIRDHKLEDRELHLFKAKRAAKSSTSVRYEYVEHYPGEARQTKGAKMGLGP